LAVYAIVLVNETIKLAFIPLAPGYAARLGLSHAELGLIIAISSLSTTIVSIPCGLLVDRVSARPVLAGAVMLLFLTAIGQGLAENFFELLLARAAFGIASGAIWVGAGVWLTGASSADSRWGRVGGIAAVSGAGALLGPAIAGVVAEAASPPTVFLVLAVPVMIVAVAFVRLSSGAVTTVTSAVHSNGLRGLWRRAIRQPLLRVSLLIMIVGGLTESVVNLLVPLALHADRVSLGIIGSLFSLAAALYLIAASLSAARAPTLISPRAAGLGMVLLGCSLTPLLLPPSEPLLALGVLLRMPFLGFLYTMSFPLASVGAQRSGVGSGAMISLVNTAYGGAVALGPLVAGAASDVVNESWIYTAIVILALASGRWMMRFASRTSSERVMTDPI
jgi:MFS family permease